MSSYVKFAAEAGDKYVAALEQSQKTFFNYLAATRNWAASAPTVTAPASKFPTPQEILTANFKLASKSISQQKEFAKKLFAMSAAPGKPAMSRKVEPIEAVPEAKAAPAAKAAAPATAKAASAKPRAKTTRSKK
jgi:hypothetical protein